MYTSRNGNEFVIELDKEEDVRGLLAVMNNSPESVSKEVYDKGVLIYGWLYKEVTELANNFQKESAIPDFTKHHRRKRHEGKKK